MKRITKKANKQDNVEVLKSEISNNDKRTYDVQNELAELGKAIHQFALQSENAFSFAKDLMEYGMKDDFLKGNVQSLLKDILYWLFEKIDELGVRICVMPSVDNFELVGGGNAKQLIPSIKQVDFSKAHGMYLHSSVPVIVIPCHRQAMREFFDSNVLGYGFDKIDALEKPERMFFTTFIHECIHAVLCGQPTYPNSNNYIEMQKFVNLITTTAKLNKLDYLTPLGASWQECITHLTTNVKYCKWILNTQNQFDLSKILMKAIPDELDRKNLVKLINEVAYNLYGIKENLVEAIPDFTREYLFLSRNYYATYPEKIIGVEIMTTNKWGQSVHVTKKFDIVKTNEDLYLTIIGRLNLNVIDWNAFDNFNKLDKVGSAVEIQKAIDKVDKGIAKRKESGNSPIIKEEKPDIISFYESVQKYNKHLSDLEINCYVYCTGESKLLWLNEPKFKFTEEEMLNSRSVITLNDVSDDNKEALASFLQRVSVGWDAYTLPDTQRIFEVGINEYVGRKYKSGDDIQAFQYDILNSKFVAVSVSDAMKSAYESELSKENVRKAIEVVYDEAGNQVEKETESEKEPELSKTNIVTINVSTIIFDGEENHYFANFFHGDVFSKIQKIKENKESIIAQRGEEYYQGLMDSFNSMKKIELTFDNDDYSARPYLSPVGDMAKSFLISSWDGDNRGSSYQYAIPLIEAFMDYVLESDWFKSSKYEGQKYENLKKAIKGKRIIEYPYNLTGRQGGLRKDLTEKEKAQANEIDMENAMAFDIAFEQATRCFSDFIREVVFPEDRKRLEGEIIEFNNKFTFTDLNKVPVGFTHSRYFKGVKDIEFSLSNTQRNACAFLNINKTGLLAYDVGSGKTISALMHISNRMDLGASQKALVVLPVPVYQKWINDTVNHEISKIDESGKSYKVRMFGSLPHLNIVPLDNLNDKIVFDLKDYSAEELAKIDGAEKEFEDYKKAIKNKFGFGGQAIEDDSQEESDSGEEEVVFSDKPKEEKVESSIKGFVFSDKIDWEKTKGEIDDILKNVNIDTLQLFGITNENNKNVDSIAKSLQTMFNDESFSPIVLKVYKGLNFPITNSVKTISDIPSYIHLSAIVNIIYYAYKELKGNYITTLGTLRKFDSNTIFFSKYSAFERFGFQEETIKMMANRLITILEGAGLEQDDMIKLEKKISNILMRSTFKAKLWFELFEFDYLCIDEAHNCKNLITKVTVDKEGDNSEYSGNTSMMKTIGKQNADPSGRALISFMMSMYVQMQNNGRNVTLLTATPFTNSPLEIYSMLCLTNYNYLNDLGYDNVLKFAQDFINIKTQLNVSVGMDVKMTAEPVGFNNLQLLKRIIFTYVNYKTGEQANVKRPCKITLPIMEKTTLCDSQESLSFQQIEPIGSIVNPTFEQQLCFDAIQKYLASQVDKQGIDGKFADYIKTKSDDYIKDVVYGGKINNIDEYREKVNALASEIENVFNMVWNKKLLKWEKVDKLFSGTAILKCLMAMRNISISPYMFMPFLKAERNLPFTFNDRNASYTLDDEELVRPKEFIESSSKLMYVLSCIREANAYQDSIGQERKCFMVYSNLGTDVGKNAPIPLSRMFKEYLLDPENNFGYKSKVFKDDLFKKAFDEVELLTGKDTKNKREALIKLFNEGKIKVLFTTVREGVDLQGNTIGVFNISVDWNPTDAKQIEGRAWRQGNRNAYCIVCYPLTANSSDMAIYQKLQDKTSRLKAIWDMNNIKSQFDLGEWSPEKMKMSMISKVDKLAPFIYIDENAELKRKINILVARKEDEEEVIQNYKLFNENSQYLRKALYIYSTLPVILSNAVELKEANDSIEKATGEIEYFKGRIEDLRSETKGYEKLQLLSDTKDAVKQKIENLEMQEFKAYKSKDTTELDRISSELEKANRSLSDIDKESEQVQNDIDKEIADLSKDLLADIKKQEKELKKAQEKIEKERKPIFVYDENIKPEFEIEDTEHGNYFKLSDSGNIVYKYETANSLNNIDYNKATIFDLLEATKRLVDAYKKESSYQYKAFSEYRDNILGGRWSSAEFDFEQIMRDYPEWLDENNFNSFAEATMGYMPSGKYMSYNYVLNNVTKFTNKQGGAYMFNLFAIEMKRGTFTKNLRRYRGIVGNEDPDEYIKGVIEKIDELQSQTSGTSIYDIPEQVIQKYIDKANEKIIEQNKQYDNYLSLVERYMTLKHTFNIPYSSVVNFELAKAVSVEPKVEEAVVEVVEQSSSVEDEKALINEQIGDIKVLLTISIDKAEIKELKEELKSLKAFLKFIQ